jgi:hypothetical protein
MKTLSLLTLVVVVSIPCAVYAAERYQPSSEAAELAKQIYAARRHREAAQSDESSTNAAALASARAKIEKPGIGLTAVIANPKLAHARKPSSTVDGFGYTPKVSTETIKRDWVKEIGAGDPRALQAALGTSEMPTVAVPKATFVPQTLVVIQGEQSTSAIPTRPTHMRKKALMPDIGATTVLHETHDPKEMVAAKIQRKKAIDATMVVRADGPEEALDPDTLLNMEVAPQKRSEKQVHLLTPLEFIHREKLGKTAWQIKTQQS